MHKGVNALLTHNVEAFMTWRIHALGHMAPGSEGIHWKALRPSPSPFLNS